MTMPSRKAAETAMSAAAWALLGSGGGDAMRVERLRRNSGDGQGGGDSDSNGGGAGFDWWQQQRGGNNGGRETGTAMAKRLRQARQRQQ